MFRILAFDSDSDCGSDCDVCCLQKYIDILVEAVENSRDLFGLGSNSAINGDDLASMSRVLSCAGRRSLRSRQSGIGGSSALAPQTPKKRATVVDYTPTSHSEFAGPSKTPSRPAPPSTSCM